MKSSSLGCHGIGVPAAQKKGFSVGKAVVGNVVGGAIAGPAGALVGTGLGFNGHKKVTFVCNKCGRVFVKRV